MAAQVQLRDLQRRVIPAPYAQMIALLCTRSGLSLMGIKLLRPIIHPETPSSRHATDEDKTTYAACLIGVGALEEATALLDEIDVGKCPMALLYKAQVLESRWSFRAAIPILEAYLAHAVRNHQETLDARLRLAAALIATKEFVMSSDLLRLVLLESSAGDQLRAHAYAIQLQARTLMGEGDWPAACNLLDAQIRSERNAGMTGEWDTFSLRKWGAIARLGRDGATLESRGEVAAIRREASHNQYWESLRQCDQQLAVITQDNELAKQLYFGTPYSDFRQDLIGEMNGALRLPGVFLYVLNEEIAAPTSFIDLLSGRDDRNRKFEGGSLPHRLVTVLTSDFYRPFNLATLFSEVYPKQPFRPESSPNRIHTLFRRLRRLSEARDYPFRICYSTEFGWYRLRAYAPFGILVCSPDIISRKEAMRIDAGDRDRWALQRIILNEWTSGLFSTHDVSGLLNSSYRRARRLLEMGGKTGWIESVRQGRHVRYRLSSHHDRLRHQQATTASSTTESKRRSGG